MKRLIAWIFILLVDVGFIAWGGMAAIWPEHLAGPGGVPIVTAGFEGYTHSSWSELAGAAPMTANYIEVVFRMYGIFNVIFGLLSGAIAITAFRLGERWAWWAILVGNTLALASAMRYDWIVNAIGPFEVTEYVGLVGTWIALAVTAPVFLESRRNRPVQLGANG
jgi:hypothetical protein